MNKFIKLTAMSNDLPIYFNVGYITKIELNRYNEAKVFTADNDWHLVKEKIEEVMNLINNL